MATDEATIQSHMRFYPSFEERRKMFEELVNSAPVEQSEYVKPLVNLTKLQGGMRTEETTPAELLESRLVTTDSLYSMPQDRSQYPSEHSSFDEARREKALSTKDSLSEKLKKRLQTAFGSTEAVVSTPHEEMEGIKKDVEHLRAVAAEAQKQGKRFEDIWLSDVDMGKKAYVDRLNLSMEARIYELQLTGGLSEEQALAQMQREFGPTIDRISTDPDYAALVGATPEQLGKLFEQSVKKAESTLDRGIGREQFQTERGYEAAKLTTAIGLDVALGFVPFVGTPLALTMSVTGDDIVLNSMTDHPVPLAWWERTLLALPAAGPLYRGGKQFTKLMTKATREGIGSAADFVVKGGVARTQAALNHLKDQGKYAKIDDIIRQVESGTLPITDSEQQLLQIAKAVHMQNRGAARAILNKGDLKPTPLLDLAKLAVLTGDVNARQKITEMMLKVGDETAKQRTQVILDTLGVESKDAQLFKSDVRTLVRGNKEVNAAEKTIMAAETRLAKAKQRLANLEKGRQAQAATRAATKATAKVAEEVEAKAASAPSFEDDLLSDVPVIEEARVGSTIKQANGSEHRVVEVTEDTVTTVSPSGEIVELSKGLTIEAKAWIMKRVTELESAENVGLIYNSDSQIDRYARAVAADVYKSAKAGDTITTPTGQTIALSEQGAQAVNKIRKAKSLKSVRAEFDSLQTAIINSKDPKGDAALEELEKLMTRVEEDVAGHGDLSSHQARVAMLGEMKQFWKKISEQPFEAKPKPAVEAPVATAAPEIPPVVPQSGRIILRKKAKEGYQVVKEADGKKDQILYHSTTKAFDEFDVNKGDLGLHFGTQEQAVARIKNKAGEFREGANIRPVKLMFKKLIEMDDITFRNPELIVASLAKGKDLPTEEIISLAKKIDSLGPNPDKNHLKLRAIRETLKRNGIDGIRYQNKYEGDGYSYLVLDPENSVIPLFKDR